jgi:hypothetical protein
MFFACAAAAPPLWTSFVRRAGNAAPAHLAAFTGKPTSHPVLIPRDVAGHPRPRPSIPGNAEWKGLLLPQILAYPAQPASAKTGLSRRRSRVRAPSLPLPSKVRSLRAHDDFQRISL